MFSPYWIFCSTILCLILFSASYGSLARFRDIERLHPVGDHTIVGASGDISDFQYLKHILENVM
jgi:20S proteasome alpha/beta subunit